ncbi:MAG: hypothetical protein H7A12_08530 [Pseudomonadales bacterium]|nr:hypothetical protein [Pseudomonadales bacterium]
MPRPFIRRLSPGPPAIPMQMPIGSAGFALVCSTPAWALVRALWCIGVQLEWQARLASRRQPSQPSRQG